jgi:Domain of unknown function (DUF4136)
MHFARVTVPVLAAAFALLLQTGCASRLRGEVSYDDHADFSRYKTFAMTPIESGQPASRTLAASEVRGALEAKGLRAADPASADVLVHVLLDRRHKMKLSGSVGGGGEWVGMEVWLEDRASGDRVWSSWAAETLTDSLVAAEEIPKAVAVIFESYPPK